MKSTRGKEPVDFRGRQADEPLLLVIFASLPQKELTSGTKHSLDGLCIARTSFMIHAMQAAAVENQVDRGRFDGRLESASQYPIDRESVGDPETLLIESGLPQRFAGGVQSCHSIPLFGHEKSFSASAAADVENR